MNAQPVPTEASSTPAMAGPTMRAMLNDVEFRPTALDRSRSPTSCDTKVWLAGPSKAVTQPSSRANAYTCHSATTPASVNTPSVNASTNIADCVAMRMRRRSKRSAAEPVKGSSTMCGPNCSAITTPRLVALWWVSCVSTSQSCAVRCTQVPMLDTSEPANQVR